MRFCIYCICILGLSFVPCKLKAAFESRSLDFFPNRGQWHANVLYKAELGSGALFLERRGFTLVEQDMAKVKAIHDQSLNYKSKDPYDYNDQLKHHALRFSWIGASEHAEHQGVGKTSYYRNFFQGKNSDKWAGGVYGSKSVEFKNLYPGIDLDFYSEGHLPKYDLIVQPGAFASIIAYTIEGAEKITLRKGKLQIQTSLGIITEEAPKAWQLRNDEKVDVPCMFVLEGNTVRFDFPLGYDQSKTLWIDPLLVFSTYTGSFADNWGFTAATDASLNAYAGGNVASTGYPVTVGAFQTSFGGSRDISISKFTDNGAILAYSTYLGGSNMENPSSIIVNSQGELIVMGSTSSADYPVTSNAFDTSFNGGPSVNVIGGIPYDAGVDLVISKFSADGTQLLGSTFFGGSGSDGVNLSKYTINNAPGVRQLVYNYGDEFRGEVNLDLLGNIYVASSTMSADIPITAYNSNTVTQDALVAKFNSDLSQLVWSARVGGLLDDAAYGIWVDAQQRVYFTGGTGGGNNLALVNNFPVTANAFRLLPGGRVDGYVSRLSSNGQFLEASTYLGTNVYDQCFFIQPDSIGEIFVMGQTEGNYPITPGLANSASSGQFVHKLSANLDSSRFSFVLGNSQNRPNFVPTAFLVNECNLLFMAGWGGNTGGSFVYPFVAGGGTLSGLPVPNATQSTTDNRDFYLTILSRDATQVLFGTFLGGFQGLSSGEHVDGGTSRFDKSGSVFQAVCAGCGGNSSFPTTPGVWSQLNNATNCNQAIFRYDLSVLQSAFTIGNSLDGDPPTGCAPLTVNFQNQSIGGTQYQWFFGDGGTSNVVNPTYTYPVAGDYTVTLVARDPIVCKFYDTARLTIRVLPLPQGSISRDTVICIGDSAQLIASGGNTYEWSPNINISDTSLNNPWVSPTSATTYTVKISNDGVCSTFRSVRVNVRSDIELNFNASPRQAYVPFEVDFINLTPDFVPFLWQFGTGDTSILREPKYTYREPGKYQVVLTGFPNNSSCIGRDTLIIEAFGFLIPNVVTPNGDGLNDTFAFEAQLSSFNLVLFNRWGREVYRKDRYDYSWNGDDVPGGVYFYYLYEIEREKEYTGWVQLIK